MYERQKCLVALSDIQIGRFGRDATSRTSDTAQLDAAVSILVRELVERFSPADTDFVLMALGDLASTGEATEYTPMGRALLGLAVELRIPRERIFMTAGNHDFDFGKNDRVSRFAAFRSFYNDFYRFTPAELMRDFGINWGSNKREILEQLFADRTNRSLTQSPETWTFFQSLSDIGLEVFGFNSAYLCDAKSSFGHFPADVVNAAHPSFPVLREGVTRIAICHHNVEGVGKGDTSAIQNPRALREFLLKHSFHFLLHGHQHFQEVRQWIDADRCLHVLGCGAWRAAQAELPEGKNQITVLHTGRRFASVHSLEHINTQETLQAGEGRACLPISTRYPAVFEGREAVREANSELILTAKRSVDQTFLASNLPSRSDDSVERLLATRNNSVRVLRVLSLDSMDAVHFAGRCLDLGRSHTGVATKVVSDPGSGRQGQWRHNVLVVDDAECMVMYSNPDLPSSNALFFHSEDAGGVLRRFVEGLDAKPLSQAVLQARSEALLEDAPVDVARRVVAALQGLLTEPIGYFGVVGSATRESTPRHRVNDIDILIIADEVTPALIDDVVHGVRKALDAVDHAAVELIPQFLDGPVRPYPHGRRRPVFQLHILLSSRKDAASWPSFIRKSRLLTNEASASYSLASIVEEPDDVREDVLDHRTWGLRRLMEYCEDRKFPCRQWEKSDDGRAVKRSVMYYLGEPWEEVEFYGYVVTKTLMNLLFINEQWDAAALSDEDTLERGQTAFRTVVGDVAEVVSARDEGRRSGHYVSEAATVADLRQKTLAFLRRAQEHLVDHA